MFSIYRGKIVKNHQMSATIVRNLPKKLRNSGKSIIFAHEMKKILG